MPGIDQKTCSAEGLLQGALDIFMSESSHFCSLFTYASVHSLSTGSPGPFLGILG